MGIFDIVKDVAKVGAEILPIVMDNMNKNTQRNVPLGPIKVYVDGDNFQATNLGSSNRDITFSTTSFINGSMRTESEFFTVDMGISIAIPHYVLNAFKEGVMSISDHMLENDPEFGGLRSLGLCATMISLGAAVRIAGPLEFRVERDGEGRVCSVVFGSSSPFDIRSVNAIFESASGSKASINVDTQKSKAVLNSKNDQYEHAVRLPEGFDPEPLLTSVDLQIQINEDLANEFLALNKNMLKEFYKPYI